MPASSAPEPRLGKETRQCALKPVSGPWRVEVLRKPGRQERGYMCGTMLHALVVVGSRP